MSTKLRIIVNGAQGAMGKVAVAAIQKTDDLELVAGTIMGDDLAATILKTNAQIVVDLTTARTVFNNTKTILEAGAHPVIGTSGLSPLEVTQLVDIARRLNLCGIIIPNLSIGGSIMMRCAALAARYFDHAEIIEMHHNNKADAPSSTAIQTAEVINQVRPNVKTPCEERLASARGAELHNVPIHSIRLPGLLAHQEVMFGSHGETLSICHDTLNRESFMPGLLLACRKVMGLDSLVYGLENLL